MTAFLGHVKKHKQLYYIILYHRVKYDDNLVYLNLSELNCKHAERSKQKCQKLHFC